MLNRDEVVHAFSTDKKLSEIQKATLLKVEVAFKDLATELLDLAPLCADRTFALRQLLISKDAIVHAVTHHTEEKKVEKKK